MFRAKAQKHRSSPGIFQVCSFLLLALPTLTQIVRDSMRLLSMINRAVSVFNANIQQYLKILQYSTLLLCKQTLQNIKTLPASNSRPTT